MPVHIYIYIHTARYIYRVSVDEWKRFSWTQNGELIAWNELSKSFSLVRGIIIFRDVPFSWRLLFYARLTNKDVVHEERNTRWIRAHERFELTVHATKRRNDLQLLPRRGSIHVVYSMLYAHRTHKTCANLLIITDKENAFLHLPAAKRDLFLRAHLTSLCHEVHTQCTHNAIVCTSRDVFFVHRGGSLDTHLVYTPVASNFPLVYCPINALIRATELVAVIDAKL